MTTVHIVENPNDLLTIVEPKLLESEAKHNLLLGLLARAVKEDTSLDKYLLGYVKADVHIVLAFIKTPGQKLIFSSLHESSETMISELVHELIQKGITIPGVIGEKHLVKKFVTQWEQEQKVTSKVDMHQFIYQLDRVNHIELSDGEMRKAVIQDVDLITDWIYDFSFITPDPLSKEQAYILASDSIHSETIFLWVDNDKIVSMAKKARPTKNGIVVNLVYTPREYRNRGYASSLVATLSQQLLDEGYKFCSLYTDASNPTSNHIYTEIGYKEIAESIVYSFCSEDS
ncbi:GNAT family N-acetyltransferase [Bacillus salitolerans]|uniref:GNAT family N-acetyltransferase n=1 Tax=Bacillus salitolerans TaxID=1437434 RepID=A0ABW4LPV2_9BACI